MGMFRRGKPGQLRAATDEDVAHLQAFAASRTGVEAFVEPRTVVTETTVVFVARDGEWTRRRVAGPKAAFELCSKLAIPCYDAAIVGYPPRMREWTQARAREQKQG
ncbi:MAG: hypothetical protein QOK42_1743 [Frankiaceae bacterium]|jgi:hypothetical protein|nr:hypothetical protein [Frankiaceae bacterium]MDX6275373.1 hypothetical protein [Frankiales bacterium]